jgi:signal peptidase II
MLKRAAIIAGLVLILDQITKAVIVKLFAYGSEREVVDGVFRLVHTRNRGVAFGLLGSSGSVVQIVLLALVSGIVAFIIWQLARGGSDGLAGIGLSLVLGGALGNLVDRVLRGEVVDFLDFYLRWSGSEHHFPAFNVADSAISVGAGIVILAELLAGMRAKRVSSTD